MTEVKHTPLPWALEELTIYALSKSEINIFDATVKAGYGDDDQKTRPETLKANAAFIVRACNHYHEMVAALKEIIESCPQEYSDEEWAEFTSHQKIAYDNATGAA